MKISALTVFVWCIAISMIVITYGLSKRAPIMGTVANYMKYRDGMAQEQKKWRMAVKKVNDAETLGKQTVQTWNSIAQAHTLPATPDPDGIDLSENGFQLAAQIPVYRNRLQAMVNNQVKAGGVKVVQGPLVPPPPLDPTLNGDKIVSEYFHYPALPAPVLVFDLGNVTVQGTFQQISDNVKAWSRMPHFLAVADGLRLQGTSPNLTGTYAVSIVGFVDVPKDEKGQPKMIFPPMPEGSRLVSAPAGGQGGGPADAQIPPKGGPGKGAGNKAGARVPGRNAGGGGAGGG